MSLRVVVLGAENVGKSGKFGIKIDFLFDFKLNGKHMYSICTYVVNMTTL